METLAVQASMGASGDMLLGMLIDLGGDREVLDTIERGLGVTYSVERVDRAGVTATNVTIEGAESTHRTATDVIDIITDLDLGSSVTTRSLAIVDRLARAEAKVHGTDPEEVHFHEVGADDAIADICGAVVLTETLSSPRVLITPIRTGHGDVDMAHGTYQIPPPAVIELAAEADWAIQEGPVKGELLTPTGAAILAEIAEGVSYLPAMHIERVGYGAGDRSYSERPNVLRGMFGTVRGALPRDEVTLLETVIDDTTPEILGSLQSTLAEDGVRDVTILPATMKKSRPGHLLQVIVDPSAAKAVARRLAEETGTLGVREIPMRHRWLANRRLEVVAIELEGQTYEVRVKVATDDAGDIVDISAEYDDALEIASRVGLPIREVCRRVESVAANRWG